MPPESEQDAFYIRVCIQDVGRPEHYLYAAGIERLPTPEPEFTRLTRARLLSMLRPRATDIAALPMHAGLTICRTDQRVVTVDRIALADVIAILADPRNYVLTEARDGAPVVLNDPWR